MQERIANIQKASANDPDGLVAPKELWLSGRDNDLDSWFRDRMKAKSEPEVLE